MALTVGESDHNGSAVALARRSSYRACCYAIFDRYKDISWRVPFALLLVILILTGWAVLYAKGKMQFVIPLLYCLVILGVLFEGQGKRVNGLLNLRPLRYLGKISYSLYMVHMFVLFATKAVLNRVMHTPMTTSPSGQAQYVLTYWQQWLVSLIAMVVLVILSDLTYRFVEDRFRIKSTRHREKVVDDNTIDVYVTSSDQVETLIASNQPS